MRNRLCVGGTLTMVLVLAIPTCRECLDAMNAPKGTSTMSADIDGVPTTFTDVRPSMYFRFSVTAWSEGTYVRLCVAGGDVGEYKWRDRTCGEYERNIAACINGVYALPGVDGCTITRSDNSQRLVIGTFNFVAVDTLRADTIRVTNGKFELYYPGEG